MENLLCLAAALVSVLLSPPEALATVELSKFLNAHLDNRLFVDNTLFVTSLVRSRLDCARQCASYLGCVTFTYSCQLSSDHGTCQGHSSSVITESINDNAIEAKTYSLSLDPCVGGNYAVIDDFRRHVDNTESAYLCDTLVPGWYRFFINGSSASMPTHCPPYGQIHVIIKELVEEKFGIDKWKEVLQRCGMREESHFLVFTVYDDPTTFKLIDAVAVVSGLPLDIVLKEFGVYFLVYCLRHGYDKMLLALGHDLFSFMQNLDFLHSMLSLSYRGMLAPSFRCQEREDGSLIIHHYSCRDGLYPIVQGLVEAVGKVLFNQVATLTKVSASAEELAPGRFKYHTTMQVQLEDCGLSKGLIRSSSINLRKTTWRRGRSCTLVQQSGSCTSPIPRLHDVTLLFPYHLVMDRHLYVQQCGDNIRRLSPIPITTSTHFSDLATILQPAMSPTLEHIVSFINSVFHIAIHTAGTDSDPSFPLKGQMKWLKSTGHVIFLGSPRVTCFRELQETRVFLSDLSMYDCSRELVLLNHERLAEIDITQKLDETTAALKKTWAALEQEKLRSEELLFEMMPKKVARQLALHGHVKAEKYSNCTVLFSDIVTFTDITVKCQADQVVNMLNDLFHRFDNHTDTHDVHKVETIGDAYMAVTGVPEAQEYHAERMADFAMDTLEEAMTVKSPDTGLPLQIRIGFHCGSVVAGVIGTKKPRFDIYGDTVNTASRMQSTSLPGRVHVSSTAFTKLYNQGYVFKRRGEIEVKGKGTMTTYFLVGTQRRALLQPRDHFAHQPDILGPSTVTPHDHATTAVSSCAANSREKTKADEETPEASPARKTSKPKSVTSRACQTDSSQTLSSQGSGVSASCCHHVQCPCAETAGSFVCDCDHYSHTANASNSSSASSSAGVEYGSRTLSPNSGDVNASSSAGCQQADASGDCLQNLPAPLLPKTKGKGKQHRSVFGRIRQASLVRGRFGRVKTQQTAEERSGEPLHRSKESRESSTAPMDRRVRRKNNCIVS